MLKDIGMLSKSEMIESDPTSILKTTEHFVSGLKRSKMIKGVSPYVIPAYPDTIIEVAKTGARINLILTPKVIKALIKDYAPAFREVKGYDNVVIRSLDRETTIGFTVTDSFLSLGLFRLDGNYDLGSDLICIGDSAVSWGNELFEYYNKMSKPL